MNDLSSSEEKKKIRVRTRVPGGRVGERPPRISRGKVALILVLAAGVGIFLGVALGRGIRKVVRIHREQDEIARSLPAYEPAAPSPSPSAGETSEGETVTGVSPGL